jgi:hypothetical protein
LLMSSICFSIYPSVSDKPGSPSLMKREGISILNIRYSPSLLVREGEKGIK